MIQLVCVCTFLLIRFPTFAAIESDTLKVNYFTADTKIVFAEYELIKIPNENYTIENILSHNTLPAFVPKEKKTEANKIYWLRCKTKNNSEKGLVINTSSIYKVDFYYPDSKTQYHKVAATAYSNIFLRQFIDNTLMFEIPHSPDVQTYYLKVTCSIQTGLGLYIYSLKEIYNTNIIKAIKNALFIGTIFLVLIYSFVLFFRVKEKIYLFYMLYLASLICYTLMAWGVVYNLIPDKPFTLNHITFFFSLMTIFLLLYSREFLLTKTQMPFWDVLIKLSIFLRIVIFFFAGFLDTIEIDISILKSALIDSILLLPAIIAGIIKLANGFKPSLYFSISFLFIYVGVIFNSDFFTWPELIIPFLPWSPNFINFSLPDVILFSYALSERLNTLRKEKDQEYKNTIAFQKIALEKAEETQQLKDKYNKELENEVQRQTAELKKANLKLEQQSAEIKVMNEILKEENEKLVLDLEVLNKARVIDREVDFEEFKHIFTEEQVCYSFLAELKWKNGYVCRKCGYKKFYKVDESAHALKCRLCGYKESATAHTLLDNVKFSLQKALYMVFLFHYNKNLSVRNISALLDLRTATCFSFIKKIQSSEEILLKKTKKDKLDNDWTLLLYIQNPK